MSGMGFDYVHVLAGNKRIINIASQMTSHILFMWWICNDIILWYTPNKVHEMVPVQYWNQNIARISKALHKKI